MMTKPPAERAAERCLVWLNFDLAKCKDDYTPALTSIITAEYAPTIQQARDVVEKAAAFLNTKSAKDLAFHLDCRELKIQLRNALELLK